MEFTENYEKQLPMMAMRGIVIFPYMITHFDVGRPKSIKALEAAMAGDQTIFLVAQRDIEVDEPTITMIYSRYNRKMNYRSSNCGDWYGFW